MNKPISIVTSDSITVMFPDGGNPLVITKNHMNFERAKQCIASGNYDNLADLMDIPKAITVAGKGRITVEDGEVYYDNVVTHHVVARRIVQMMNAGEKVDHMIKFLGNLMENPSYRAVNELYDWLEKSDLPITDDGHFLAYKAVRSDYTDCRTGKIDNRIGQKPSMPRNMVDEDKHRTCSDGLHFCSKEYLSEAYSLSGSNRVMMLKINPRDVVAIPSDCNNSKGRCCLYEVISELKDNKTKGDVMKNTTVYHTGAYLTKEEAIVALGLDGTKNPNDAFRKRLQRGTAVMEDQTSANTYKLLVDPVCLVMTFDKAMSHLGITANALRKRLQRGTKVRGTRVQGIVINEVRLVKFVE